jgi:hypothetical protein
MEGAMTVPELTERYFSYLKDNVCGCNFCLLEGAMIVPELTEMYFSYLNDNGYEHVKKWEGSDEKTGVVFCGSVSFKKKNRYCWINVEDKFALGPPSWDDGYDIRNTSLGGLRFTINTTGRSLETATEKKYALCAANDLNMTEGSYKSGKAFVGPGRSIGSLSYLGTSVCLLLQSPEQFKDFFDRALNDLLQLMIAFEEELSQQLSRVRRIRKV